MPPGQRVVRLRQAEGCHTTPSVQDQPLGSSLGRETSESSEKPEKVAKAVLLLKPTDPPRWRMVAICRADELALCRMLAARITDLRDDGLARLTLDW